MLNNYYNKALKPFARENRSNSNKAEIRIWCELFRGGKIVYPILRQRPILNYIADFFCKELKLLIEIDGITHNDRLDKDKIRDNNLESLGYTTLRFWDSDVMENIEGVEAVIREKIQEIEKKMGINK